MRLNQLHIQHFKKIDELTIRAGGKNVEIRGENGAGKTTVYDAYTWCLFGKSGTGEGVESQIKRKAEDGTVPPDGGVDHIVEIELQKDDGETMTLRRSYREVWAKKRGQAQSEFTGHTTDYTVNGVPVQKREFADYVGRIGNEDAFRLLSMPLHFCTKLHWKERRQVLLQVCGNVADADVIDANEKLAALPQLLGSKSIDELRKVIAAKKKEINKELEKIPARIDELQKQMPDTADLPMREVLDTELASLKKQQSNLERQIVRIENGGEIAAKKKEIAEIEAQQMKIKAQMDAAHASGAGVKERMLKDLKAEKNSLEKYIETLKSRATILQGSIDTAQENMVKLRERFQKRSHVEFISPVEDICPACGQPLPADKKAAAEAKAREQFNLDRSAALAEINEAGKVEKKRVDADRKMLDDFAKDAAGKQLKVDGLKLEIEKVEAEIEIAQGEKVALNDYPGYKELAQQKEALQNQIAMLKDDAVAEIRKLQGEIAAYNTDITSRQNKIASLEQCKNMRCRIAQLKEHEAALGKEYSEVEKQLFMTEEFIRSKVSMLEEKINSKFGYVKFKLFDTKINGALEECCEPMIDGVPFGDGLNTGSRMKAGMDIVNVLSAYYGLNLPIWIDNCESYTELIPVNSQIITLYAKDGYETLDIQVDELPS